VTLRTLSVSIRQLKVQAISAFWFICKHIRAILCELWIEKGFELLKWPLRLFKCHWNWCHSIGHMLLFIYSLFRTSAAEHMKYTKQKHTVLEHSKKAKQLTQSSKHTHTYRKNYTTEQSDKDTIYSLCFFYIFCSQHLYVVRIIICHDVEC